MSLLKRVEPITVITLVATLLSTMTVIIIFAFLMMDSYPLFSSIGLNFFIDKEWHPSDGTYGALPMIYGTMIVTLLSLIFSLPVATGSAVFISEFLPERLRVWVKGCMELLAGIPSIVYGLVGIAILNEIVKSTFTLNDGGSKILTASILLGIMILPTIMTISEDAIHNVPAEYREASLGLGLTKIEAVTSAVIPMAMPGILSAILLGIGRAMGETMAVMLVIGSIDRLPSPFYNILSPSQTMTSKLGREAAEGLGSGLHWNALVSLGLILFIMVIGITLLSEVISKRWKRQ